MDAAALTLQAYRLLGRCAVHTSVQGVVSRAVPVIVERGAPVSLGGMAQTDASLLKMPSALAPDGVQRGDLFDVDGITWRAREAGHPIRDGEELAVPVAPVVA